MGLLLGMRVRGSRYYRARRSGDEFRLRRTTLEDALLDVARAAFCFPTASASLEWCGTGEEFLLGVHRQAPARCVVQSAQLQDGSAWWAARAAINRAHDVRDPKIRSSAWFIARLCRVVRFEPLPDLHQCAEACARPCDLELFARHPRITAARCFSVDPGGDRSTSSGRPFLTSPGARGGVDPVVTHHWRRTCMKVLLLGITALILLLTSDPRRWSRPYVSLF